MERDDAVLWSPLAADDLVRVWGYFARVASPEIADRLILEIDAATSRLAQTPFMGRPRDEFGPHVRSILAHPYTIFYRMRGRVAEVIRVLHERQDGTAATFERTAA